LLTRSACRPRVCATVRALITSGEVKRPQLLLGPSTGLSLLSAPQGAQPVDAAALALRAFAGDKGAAPGALAALPRGSEAPVYRRDIGVDPAARPRRLGPTEAAEAAGLRITPAAFRDLTLPD
jgi:hypothetical protein